MKDYIKILVRNKRCFWHRWRTDMTVGKVSHEICDRCQARRIITTSKHLEEIDFDWLYGKGVELFPVGDKE